MNAPRLPPGTILAGKYTIQSELGRTTSSATYAAIAAPGREMVLRLVATEACDETKANELRALHAQAANVPEHLLLRVVEDGRDEASAAWFMATPRSQHPNLAELVALCPFEAKEAMAFVTSLARASSALHASGIAHLGLHPKNVFVGPAPERSVRVGDLAARRIDRATMPWAAPEQLEGGQGSIATDVYAIANLAFYALTGKAFADATADDRAKLPPGAEAAITRALATSPAERFASLEELHAAIASGIGVDVPEGPLFLTAPPPAPPPLPPPSAPAVVPSPSAAFAPAPLPPPPAFAASADFTPDALDEPPPPSVVGKGPPWRAIVAAASFFVVLGITAVLVLRAREPDKPVAPPAPKELASQSAAPPPSPQPPPPPAPTPEPSPTPPSVVASAEPPAPSSSSPPSSSTSSTAPTIALKPTEGELLVMCEPQCGLVLLDGKQLKAYPKPAAVRAGNHGIGVSKPGHGGQWKPVTVVKGARNVVKFTLTPTGVRGKG